METPIKKIPVQNYAAFIPIDDGEKKYKIITDDAGNEKGIEVKGYLTKFGEANFNGQNFDRKSYDQCIQEYFEKNELNIPIDLMHVRDAFHLAGVCKKFQKKSDGIEITAFIAKGVYFYGLIKTLIDNGILQGFSNLGFITDYDWNRQTDELIVKAFQLISISLVDVPADTFGKFATQNTIFEGFKNELEKEKEQKIKNELNFYGI